MSGDKLRKYLDHGICPVCDKKSNFAYGTFVQSGDLKRRVVYCLDCKGSFDEVSETVALEKR